MRGREGREGEGEVLREIKWEEKECGGFYGERSDDEIGRRNMEVFLIYVFKNAHFPVSAT